MRWTPGKFFLAMLVVTVGFKLLPFGRHPVRRAAMPSGAAVLQSVPRPTATTDPSHFGVTTNLPEVPAYPGSHWTQWTNNQINSLSWMSLQELERETARLRGQANALQAGMAADDIHRSVMDSERRRMSRGQFWQQYGDFNAQNASRQ
jgi:hypothetical protein